MNTGRSGVTDLAEVLVRACHHREDHPRIFSDPYAQRLLTDSEREFIETWWLEPSGDRVPSHRTHAVRSALRAMPLPAIMLARAQYSEQQLFTSVQLCGARQYVQIAAGMDTFAFRRPDMRTVVDVFEVDRPGIQSFKRARLAEVDLESPANLHFVACDVESESVAAALSHSAYRAGEPTFFAWLGATMFLRRDVILDVLSSIPTVARIGTQLVFDYIDMDAFEHERVSDRLKRTMEVLRRLGEPMITGFAPSALAGELAGVGFRLIEDLAPEDLQSRFFSRRTDGFRATEHFHLARAEVV